MRREEREFMENWGRQLIGRAVESLARYRFLWLAFVILIPALCYPIARRLSFDQNIQSLFSEDDERLLEFIRSKSHFGGDEFAVVAWREPNLFEPVNDPEDSIALTEEARKRIIAFGDQLDAIPGVNAVSTQHLADALKFRFRRELVLKVVENVLVSEDRMTTAIVLRLQPISELTTKPQKQSGIDESDEDSNQSLQLRIEPTDAARTKTIAAIRKVAREHKPSAYVVGEPIQVDDMFRIVQADGSKLFVVSLAILSCVLFFLFRNLRWVVLPITAVIATIVCTEAMLVLTQIRLSMVSSMLNSMVTIIVIATSTHVTVHYRELRNKLEPEAAMCQTLRDLGAPVFWTCATTAVGFMALLSSEITPVSSFGLMMGLASMVAFIVFALLFPGGILAGKRRPIPREAPAEEALSKLLTRISNAIARRPLLLWLVGLLIMAATIPGLFRLRMETDFSKNFSKDSDIVQSLEFFESELGGAGTWEVNFPAPPLSEIDEAYLDRVRNFGNRLKEIKGPDGKPAIKVGSLMDGMDMLPKLKFGAFTSIRGRLIVLKALHAEFVPSLYDIENGRMRIVLRSREQQRSEDKLALIERVNELAKAEFSDLDDPEEPPTATGMFVLLTFVIQSLLGDQIVSFAWAALGISLMMTLAFRSVTLGLLSLIPNIFPIVLVIGTMGWLGTPVNIGTAMIASVSMGLTVDSTIHYISAFRRALETKSIDEAIRDTHQGVGRALVFAHIALIAGFLVLTLSDFVPLVYFGVLLSLSMVGALIGDLVMLPVLLRWLYGRKLTRQNPVTAIN
ncbi:MAG: RND family transporter [Planctomycetaceae bacterium]